MTYDIEKDKAYRNPEPLAQVFYSILDTDNEVDRDKEHFWTVGLSGGMKIKYIELVTLGLLDQSLVHPRETFRLAIMKGVACIICVHNHPGGQITPSSEDVDITNVLKEAGKILSIRLMDHIIIGSEKEKGYLSFQEAGLM